MDVEESLNRLAEQRLGMSSLGVPSGSTRRARCGVLLLFALTTAACGGGGHASSVAAKREVSSTSKRGAAAESTTSTAAPTTTTTTEPPTTTTTADPAIADLAAIKAMWRAQNTAWKIGVDDGLRVTTETAWPQGAWTPQMWFCASAGSTYERDVQISRDRHRMIEHIVEPDSLEPAPGWSVPGNGPGSGQVPPGRIYIMRLTTNDSEFGDSSDEGHAVVGPDGVARWFPVPC